MDDQKFAYYWVENRSLKKGISRRKLISELKNKGIDNLIIEQILSESERNDITEIKKIIDKKSSKYSDENKLMAYLSNQGFSYGDIKEALSEIKQNY